MPFSPADSRILSPLFGAPELAAIFTDDRFVHEMLRVEGALARAQGGLGVIPEPAASRIAAACSELTADLDDLARGAAHDGFPVIALVRQIRARVGNEAAGFVHFGATTQDIMDTALVLQVRDALDWYEAQVRAVIRALAALAQRHRTTVMAGRTHSQQAVPISFGFKAATWLAPLVRHVERLRELRPRVLVLQFGGAAGTLAALRAQGVGVHEALARELHLGVPPLPWHTARDGFAELAGWLSLVSGSLAKMAQDVVLLAQTEVGEIRESADVSRGGSSTMPQKSNPIASELVVAAARANATLLSGMHQALVQEHERATHGWQLEWLLLPQMFAHTAAALTHARRIAEHLVVDEARMAENVSDSNGLMLAEAFSVALAAHMPLARAKQIVAEAARRAAADGRHLADLLRDVTDAPLDWDSLRDERSYLGAADLFVERVLRAAEAV
jgi:3-carboxy-cis,cis-muconate cycloisomerase